MKKKVLGATTLLLLLFHPVFSSELKILTENLPPLNYVKDDILVGPAVEIVKEIQKRVGSHEPIKVYPWVRAYQMALREENIVLFGMTHTTERNRKFKWIGPIAYIQHPKYQVFIIFSVRFSRLGQFEPITILPQA